MVDCEGHPITASIKTLVPFELKSRKDVVELRWLLCAVRTLYVLLLFPWTAVIRSNEKKKTTKMTLPTITHHRLKKL
jgi:hypothetical protein